ncbi:MAG: cas3 [Hydrocarboniphaga sp.]|uniref:DEAD/DEAH box helicase n=1 Tax=Hydrocarboniphaga sp. TaxID=2033016 RepID=UPI002616DB5E|nr:DEAD/DEAH box helicase [Hydrocarboniphaga sp.]MDB5970185.1 cas3 [Hydrocarboniphaga sp.]
MNYGTVFRGATCTDHSQNGFDPMAWQCRLACGETAAPQKPETLTSGVACESRLIDIPTGCGKTEGLILAWLWNRVVLNKLDWPTRLVYCVPMRTLVEQTRERVAAWSTNLLNSAAELDLRPEALADLRWLAEHSPVILMGGEESTSETREWDIHPEKPAILIGTQDMLLSRALNRGYAMRRPRWPMHFGLLNNDCLWICDEVQLMGPGVATACQLEAFRRDTTNVAGSRGLASFFGSRSATWYASATSSPNALKTREWRDVQRPSNFVFSLSQPEKSDTSSTIGRRRWALKKLAVHRDWHFGDKQPPEERVVAIIDRHREMVAAISIPRQSRGF